VELQSVDPGGVRRVEARPITPGTQAATLMLPVSEAGKYLLAVRLLNLETGKVLGQQQQTLRVKNVLTPIERARTQISEELDEARADFLGRGLGAAIRMEQLRGEVDTSLEMLSARIAAASDLKPAELDRLLADADAYMTQLDRCRALMVLARAEVEAERAPVFAMWQDREPWDNADPLDELPGSSGPVTLNMWAFGNEWESACVNIVNLAPHPLRLRVEPGTIDPLTKSEGLQLPDTASLVRFHTTVPLPSANRELVPDMLPRLGDGQILDLAPGQVKQLWLNISTHTLPAGEYELRWPVRTLDARTDTAQLSIKLDVSPVRCPEKSRYLTCYWSPATPRTIPDMNEHLVTMWQGIPLPPAKANAQGEIVGEIDWSEHDALVEQLKQPEILFYGNAEVPVPEFPEGLTVTDALKLQGQRAYAERMVAHLSELGFGYEDFMFYPEDEPGLKGEITSFLEHARRNRLIDPKIQNYANPWECTYEMLHEMWEVTDVWQPGMEVLEFLGKEAVDIMHRGGKRIATYTPPGTPRTLRPLGFFRSQPWLSLHWGIEGGGWYTYQLNDLFLTGDLGEPGYGGVHVDSHGIVPSRRWEAMRDGIEDFNIVSDLRDLAEQKGDRAAQTTIDAAVAFVANRVLTGATREAAEYDFSYAEFMTHRAKIRQEYERLLLP
jgi:hypothetical protein